MTVTWSARALLLGAGIAVCACGGGPKAPTRSDGGRDMGAAGTGGGGGGGTSGGAGSGGFDAAVDVTMPRDMGTDLAARDAAVDAARDGAADSAPDAARDMARDMSPDAPPPATMVFAPWVARDIGTATALPGQVAITSALWTVRAGGTDVGATVDSFHFIHQPFTGDGEIIARVASVVGDPMSKAGIMLRATLDPNAPNFFIAVQGDGTGGRLQYRTLPGGPTVSLNNDGNLRPSASGQFIRITRVGRTLTAYRSSTRASWSRIGSTDIDLPAQVYVGVAAEGHSTTMLGTSTINYLHVTNLEGNAATAAWRMLDLGGVGGTVIAQGNTLTVTGAGEEFNTVMSGQEYLTFALRQVSGNVTLTARIASVTPADEMTRVGVMIREGNPDSTASRSSAHAMISVTPMMGALFQSRTGQGGTVTAGAVGATLRPPLWLKIEKVDQAIGASQLTGSYSMDGVMWTPLDTATFSLSEPSMLGVFVAASSPSALATARFENVTVTLGTTDGGAADGAAGDGAAGDGAVGDAGATGVDAAASADAVVDAVSGG